MFFCALPKLMQYELGGQLYYLVFTSIQKTNKYKIYHIVLFFVLPRLAKSEFVKALAKIYNSSISPYI